MSIEIAANRPAVVAPIPLSTSAAPSCTIRPARPTDEPALRAMVDECSDEDLLLRCFSAGRSFPTAFVARLARCGGGEFALVAEAGPGLIAGVVHAVADPARSGHADYDILVRTDLKGRGIGTRLMRAMMARAAEAGFHTVSGDVLDCNGPMLRLARDLGFRRVGMEGDVVRLAALSDAG